MEWMMQERVDLARSQGLTRWPGQLMHPGDALAHRWVVSVYRDGEPVDLTGWAVTAYMTRQDGACVPVPGAADGCVAGVVLLAACYDCPGTLTGTLQASKGDVRITLARGVWQVGQRHGDQVIDPDAVVPSLPELLAQISAMEAATVACTEATAAAEAAIGVAAPPIVEEASGTVAVCSDAAARPAVAVVTTLLPQQDGDGTPSADNVRPILPHTAAALYHAASYMEEAAACAFLDLPDVYGGLLDWASGQLTVTHHSITLDGTRLYWVHGSNNYYLEIADMAHGVPLLCDCCTYVKKAVTQLALGEVALGSISGDVQRVCFGNPGNAITRDEWVAMRDAQPIQMVYELKEPYTVQLTAQQISLLRGGNALWSDAGETVVSYIADTKTYIDTALAAIAAAVIAQ